MRYYAPLSLFRDREDTKLVKLFWTLILLSPQVMAADATDTRLLTHFDRFLIKTQTPIIQRLKSTAYEWEVEQARWEKSNAPLSPIEYDPQAEARAKHYRNQTGRALGRAIGRDFEILRRKVFTRTNADVDIREFDDNKPAQEEATIEKNLLVQGIEELTNFDFKTSLSTSRALVRINYDWLNLSSEYRFDGVSKMSASKDLPLEVQCNYTYFLSHGTNQLAFSRSVTDLITAHYILQDEGSQSLSENIFKLDYSYSF